MALKRTDGPLEVGINFSGQANGIRRGQISVCWRNGENDGIVALYRSQAGKTNFAGQQIDGKRTP